MTLTTALAAASLLCGMAVGLAVNLLVKERAREALPFALGAEATAQVRRQGLPATWHRQRTARSDVLRGRRTLLLLNPLLLGAASLGLARLPGLETPMALSQALLLVYLLYPLALVDLMTLTIEPALVLGGLLLRMVVVFSLQREAATDMLGGMLAGAGLLALVGFAYQWVRGREGLGEGDAAVLGLIGAFVGWQGILPVVLLGTATGLLTGVPLLLALRRPLQTPLPFAPFLCAGGLAVYLAQMQGWTLFGLLPRLGG